MKKQNEHSTDNGSRQRSGNTDRTSGQLNQMQNQADKDRTRKAGSQSNQSDRHNTGRGGGK